jgi:hypothetical protein
MHGSATHFSKQATAAALVGSPKAKSSLVRRLVAAEDDPAKRRIRAWLTELDDERLSGLGLTSEDIAILRGTRVRQAITDHRTSRRVTDRRAAQRGGARALERGHAARLKS